jgi:hypothetical protein
MPPATIRHSAYLLQWFRKKALIGLDGTHCKSNNSRSQRKERNGRLGPYDGMGTKSLGQDSSLRAIQRSLRLCFDRADRMILNAT